MLFTPTLKAIEPDSAPEATVVPLTVIVAVASDAVGVNLMVVVALDTLSV
jgi:hypothetical protein